MFCIYSRGDKGTGVRCTVTCTNCTVVGCTVTCTNCQQVEHTCRTPMPPATHSVCHAPLGSTVQRALQPARPAHEVSTASGVRPRPTRTPAPSAPMARTWALTVSCVSSVLYERKGVSVSVLLGVWVRCFFLYCL